jgi:hypothetical protein
MRVHLPLLSLLVVFSVFSGCEKANKPVVARPTPRRSQPVMPPQGKKAPLPLSLPSFKNIRFLRKQAWKGSTPHFVSSLWRQGKRRLVIREYGTLQEKVAEKLLKDETFLLNSMFVEHRSPYPGLLSQKKGCPPESKPQRFQKKDSRHWMSSFRLWANKRLVHGGCLPSMNHYRTAVVFLYCKPSKKFFHLKYYVPATHGKKQDLLPWVKGVRCP